jgi:membrane protease subunit (stomatin/prohibitin family)
MGLFGSGKEGGTFDVIRCDEVDYLIWKWRPSGEANSTAKENAIRWGSSLRVKDGEVAVFVYKKNDGTMQDFIVGPHDEAIKTANLPILTSLIGYAYAGKSPFQAEIYFINLAGNVQLKFAVPYFDVFDPRFLDFAVPITARGTITFNITDYPQFIKLHRMVSFDLSDFGNQVRDAVTRYVKKYISNLPFDASIPVLQIERKIVDISDSIDTHVRTFFRDDFGVNLKRFDLASIEIDKDSTGYIELRSITAEQQKKTINAQTGINIRNLDDTQRINAVNLEDALRVQREEIQRKQRLQTESQHLAAHQVNQQTTVLKTAAESLASMGNMNLGSSDGGTGGFNPAGMMTGMMLGGSMGGQMASMMNQVGQTIQQAQLTPPPPPQIQYNIAINGQTAGPFVWSQLKEMVLNGQLNKSVHVWKQGMADWELAGNVQELAPLFQAVPPAPPPPPPSVNK